MLHRFFAPQKLTPGEDVAVSGEEFHHAARVVRLRAGDEVELFDGKGMAARGRTTAFSSNAFVVRIESLIPSRESPIALHLAMAVIQLEKFELVLQKATELGARSIVPLVTDRVEIRSERYRGKQERWERIVFEAVKQSGRATIPELNAPVPFRELMAREGAKVVFDADEPPTADSASPADLTLCIGPEGGWSEEEVALARERGCIFARLGPRRLRAETAAIVAMALRSEISMIDLRAAMEVSP